MSRLSAVLTEALVSMLAACAVCFAQQHFDHTKPQSTQEANAELDAIKYKSLTEFLRPDPKSRIKQDSESDVYFTEVNAIGDVGDSSCRQRDLPNHHERCFVLLKIYHHLHAPSPLVAGATDAERVPRPVGYWGIVEDFQIMCEEDSIREMGSVVYRESTDGDADDLWNGGWEDSGYGRPGERRHAIDETDRLAVLARERLCKG